MEAMRQADATRSETEPAPDRCIDSMTPQMRTVRGLQRTYNMRSRDLQSMVRSPIMFLPAVCMILSAPDFLWRDFLEGAFRGRTARELGKLAMTESAECYVLIQTWQLINSTYD